MIFIGFEKTIFGNVKQKGGKLTQSAEAFVQPRHKECVGDTHPFWLARSSTSFFFLYACEVRYISYTPSSAHCDSSLDENICRNHVVRSLNKKISYILILHTNMDPLMARCQSASSCFSSTRQFWNANDLLLQKAYDLTVNCL